MLATHDPPSEARASSHLAVQVGTHTLGGQDHARPAKNSTGKGTDSLSIAYHYHAPCE